MSQRCEFCRKEKAVLMWLISPCCQKCFNKLIKRKIENQEMKGGMNQNVERL